MFNNMSEVNLKAGDRVAVIHDGQIRKAHVADVVETVVMVTLEKDGPAVAFDRNVVFPLYRPGSFVFCMYGQFPKAA